MERIASEFYYEIIVRFGVRYKRAGDNPTVFYFYIRSGFFQGESYNKYNKYRQWGKSIDAKIAFSKEAISSRLSKSERNLIGGMEIG